MSLIIDLIQSILMKQSRNRVSVCFIGFKHFLNDAISERRKVIEKNFVVESMKKNS